MAHQDLDRARAVLFGARPPSLEELRRSSWKDTLRKAFRKRAFETHPDRARALGRSEATLTVEFRELERAYELVTAHLSAPVPVAQPRQPAPPVRPQPSAPQRPRTARQPQPPAASAPRGARAARPAPPPASPPRARARTEEVELFYKGPMPRRALRFAEFLYYSGVVSWQQLVAAIAWQRQRRPRVGELAVACGLMTKAEVEQLLGHRLRLRSISPFAQFAVEAGRLSAAQRAILLAQQRSMQPRIGQYFIDQGLISAEQLEHLLHCVKQMNAAVEVKATSRARR